MTLRDKQSAFAVAVAHLILEARVLGYDVTLGEAYRTPEQAALNAQTGAGIAKSLHTLRLAIDLHLFTDGVFLTKTEDYLPLGQWWEGQSTPAVTYAWGGRFLARPDGNHFSFAHDGRR